MSEPTTTFSNFNFDQKINAALANLNLSEPTAIQQQAIPTILEGREVIASAQTGTGKTLAFLLPIMQKMLTQPSPRTGCRALILTPTRELAEQIGQQIKNFATHVHLNYTLLTGGAEFKYQAALLRKNPEFIVATPGRLTDHLRRNSTDLNDLEFLVFDEADRMLDLGFKDDIEAIAEQANDQRQNLLFSATLENPQLVRIAQSILDNPVTIKDRERLKSNSNITHQFVLCDDEKFKQKAIDQLLKTSDFEKCIVFTNTKAQANRLRGVLDYLGHHAGCLHGDMTQDQRKQILKAFRTHKFKVLVATDVAARGLDITGVKGVIQYDMARSTEDYIHRSGRTGRAGATGLSVCFICAPDWNNKARCENAVGETFTKISVPGLTAKYKGPEKLKSSGKAAGKKKTASKPEKNAKPKNKVRARDTQNKGRPKRFGPAPKKSQTAEKAPDRSSDDGFAPFKKAKKD